MLTIALPVQAVSILMIRQALAKLKRPNIAQKSLNVLWLFMIAAAMQTTAGRVLQYDD